MRGQRRLFFPGGRKPLQPAVVKIPKNLAPMPDSRREIVKDNKIPRGKLTEG